MENNIENKEKFFAQYWGQKVFKNDSDGWGLRLVDHNSIYPIENEDYLELKPLSEISDEHAAEVAKIYYDNQEATAEDGRTVLLTYYTIEDRLPSVIAEFIRSKGYALPWMELSVEEQVSRGWVKLKEN